MFRLGHPLDQPLRIVPELFVTSPYDGTYPILREQTPVRMDLTHSAWSDIFFLGMDFPEGAKVLNVSVNLGVHGRDAGPRPPVEAFFRVIDEPVLRLVSVDLGTVAEITQLAEVFDFAKDYLGLLKAAVIASGIVPPGIEGSGQSLAALLAQMVGEGRGLEIVSNVNIVKRSYERYGKLKRSRVRQESLQRAAGTHSVAYEKRGIRSLRPDEIVASVVGWSNDYVMRGQGFERVFENSTRQVWAVAVESNGASLMIFCEVRKHRCEGGGKTYTFLGNYARCVACQLRQFFYVRLWAHDGNFHIVRFQ